MAPAGESFGWCLLIREMLEGDRHMDQTHRRSEDHRLETQAPERDPRSVFYVLAVHDDSAAYNVSRDGRAASYVF